jgi:pimeloyl-ACP methyl ester carboxylesterase
LSVPSIDEDGGLASTDSPSVFQSSITIQAVDTSLGPRAFAIYRAPTDFARRSSLASTCAGVTGTDTQLPCRLGAILIQGSVGGSALFPVTIVRPPVFLIHGIWSDRGTWSFFSPLVTGASGSDPRFHVYRADYSQHSGDSIDFNERGVFDQLTQYISTFKQDLSVAAIEADIVAHSMGGLVARDMVLDPRFVAQENFQHGIIHKLITIGTPHNGSSLATQLIASSSLCKLAFGYINRPVSGAVTDMSLGNPFLAFLNNSGPSMSLKAHAIVGTASTGQELASQASLDIVSWGVFNGLVCSNLLPPIGGYRELFGGSSDLLVSTDSQQFGFNGTLAVDFPAEDMIHTVAPIIYPLGPDELNRDISLIGFTIQNPGIPVNPNLVLNLLNTPVTDSAFVAIRP